MSEVSHYHNPEFNGPRQQAHDFVAHDLGLDVAPLDNIAIITPSQAMQLRAHHGDAWHDGYNPDNNTAVVINGENPAGPITTAVQNSSAIVHEITHSGTANESHHAFYYEALAGIAEQKWLERLQAIGRYRPAFSFTLERAGVSLWVPNNFRYLDSRESHGTLQRGAKGAQSSQAMLAALGVAHTLPKSGLTSNALLAASSRGGNAPYLAMKQSLETLKPGLAKEIEAQPQTTDGIIRASSIIQTEAKKQRLF